MLVERANSLLVLIDVQEKLFPLISDNKTVQAHCEWVLSLAKALSVSTLITEQYPKGLGHTIGALSPFLTHAKRMSKSTISCVADEAIALEMEKRNKEQYLLMGIEAHACVMQTALALRSQGKEVFVIYEAIGSRTPSDKERAVARMQQQGVQIISREMLFFEWLPDSKTPEFKTLSKQFLK
jgi:nicotinamidase-related amidase